MPCIDTAYDVFDQQYDDILKMESVKSSLKGVVEKLLEYHNIMSIVELEDTFVEGFSLAVTLLLESLSKK